MTDFIRFFSFCSKMSLANISLLSFGLFVINISFFSSPSRSQISQAVIQEIVDGDRVFIDQKPATVNDKADFGQVIKTQDAKAGILFNNGASGRLGNNAKVIVGQCVEVEQGELLISGPVNGCMAGLTVAVKGTLYVLKKTKDNEETVEVLEGTVQVKDNNKPEQTVEVTSGQKVSFLDGVLGQAIALSQDEITNILKGQLFQGFSIPVTPDGALQQLCSQLLPGLTCSSDGLPSYPLPIPSIPVPFSLPF